MGAGWSRLRRPMPPGGGAIMLYPRETLASDHQVVAALLLILLRTLRRPPPKPSTRAMAVYRDTGVRDRVNREYSSTKSSREVEDSAAHLDRAVAEAVTGEEDGRVRRPWHKWQDDCNVLV